MTIFHTFIFCIRYSLRFYHHQNTSTLCWFHRVFPTDIEVFCQPVQVNVSSEHHGKGAARSGEPQVALLEAQATDETTS